MCTLHVKLDPEKIASLKTVDFFSKVKLYHFIQSGDQGTLCCAAQENIRYTTP